MRLETVITSVERGGNFQEKAFTIKADAKMFNLLSDKIYADKPGAVVREIASNAKDAHAAAGYPDRPFDIHVPNEMYPHLSVRDYGKGLTHEEMFEIYTTYSESTKTNTNKEIGAFGVGAKSPFAYTDNFTVISRVEGRKRTYTAYIGEEGIPVLALMNDEECDDPTGLEVIVPIRNNDFYVFREKIFNVLQYFTPTPNVVGVSKDHTFADHTYVYEGTGWGVRKTRGSSARVIQGGVFYPIDFQTVFERNVPSHLSGLTNQPLDLHFDMFDGVGERGNLDVALSREALSYDAYTREQLKKMMQIVYEEIGTRVVADLDQVPTFWEACSKYAELKETFGSLIPDNLKWRGTRELKKRADFKFNEYSEHIHVVLYANQRGFRTGSIVDSIYGDFYSLNLFFDDLDRGTASRIKEHIRHRSVRTFVIALRSNTAEAKSAYKKFIDDIGNPPIKDASTLPKPPKTIRYAKTVNDEQIDCLRWEGGYSRSQRGKWKGTTVKVNDGGYYVQVDHYNIVTAPGHEIYNMNGLTAHMNTLKILPAGVPIYGFGKRAMKVLSGRSNWINIADLARERCNDQKVKELIVRDTIRDIISEKLEKADGYPTLNPLFDRSNSINSTVHRFVEQLEKDDAVKFFQHLSTFEPTSEEALASSWNNLSGIVEVTHINYNETEKRARAYVAELKKLWDVLASNNKILNYVNMNLFGDAEFNSSLIQFINKGA